MLEKDLKIIILNYIASDENDLSVFNTRNAVNFLPKLNSEKLSSIINLEKVNNLRRINKFHIKVNESLNVGSIYVSCGETIIQRENRIKKKIIFGFKHAFILLDFIYKRVMPKIQSPNKYIFQ